MTGERFATPIVGLLLISFLGLIGCAALLLAATRGAPQWLFDAYLALAVVLLALYAVLVFLPQRRLEAALSAARLRSAKLEEVLSVSLDKLQEGELATLAEGHRELPEGLQASFAASVASLAALVQQIQNSSTEVAAAGETVQTTASDLASGSSEQAAGVVEITATMEELARTAAQIAANAARQADGAVRAEDSGNSGAAAVEEALHGVEAVQKRIGDIANRADILGSRSKDIYRVLDLITEIAHETHILSLNAAIEASAAGDSGRRFSVVADEVRRLAQRARESVDSVRTLLDEFAGSTRASVVATEEATKEAARVLERARHAAASIAELRGALSDTARAAREISLATEQQRTASDQVVLTLKEVSQVIHRIAEGLKQFSGASEKVNKLALSIQLLTQSFHLDSPRSLKHLAEGWARELGDRAGHWEAAEGFLGEVVRANSFIEMAWLVDRGGNMIAFSVGRTSPAERATSTPVVVGANYADRPWFQAVIRDARTAITPLYDSLLTGERCFTVATAVQDGQSTKVGVLGFDVNVRGWTRI